jgi:hypothetical protein
MVKEKAESTTDDGTIGRKKPAPKPTPKASKIEKVESFTAAFKSDAHAAADHWLDDREEVSREESDAGPDGVKVTVTYK